MVNPKIFISHSTSQLPENDRTVKIRDCIYDILSKKGWDVFLDKKEIKPGDKWRTEILQNLEQSQAGIILFNKKATSGSEWVQAEAMILSYRKSIYPKFKLIAILLDKIDLKEECFKIYEPFQLNETQFVHDNIDIEPEKFIDEQIAPNLDSKEVAGKPPQIPWVAEVISILEKVDSFRLMDVAEQLELIHENKLSVSNEENKHVLTRAIAELMHHNISEKSLEVYSKLINPLAEQDAKKLGKLLKAKWVDNRAAQILLCASRDPEKVGFFTLNWENKEIEKYMHRAIIEINNGLLYQFSVDVKDCGDSDDPNVKLFVIEKAIMDHIFPPDISFGNDSIKKSLQEKLKEKLKEKKVAICALPSKFAQEQILEQLNQRFPNIIFIVQIESEAAKLTNFKSIGGKPLNPLLDTTKRKELSEMEEYIAIALINKKTFEE